MPRPHIPRIVASLVPMHADWTLIAVLLAIRSWAVIARHWGCRHATLQHNQHVRSSTPKKQPSARYFGLVLALFWPHSSGPVPLLGFFSALILRDGKSLSGRLVSIPVKRRKVQYQARRSGVGSARLLRTYRCAYHAESR